MDGKRPWRRKLFGSSLLLGILAGAVLAICHARQNGMDAALLAAIRRDDTSAAVDWLNAGADANASAWVGPPTSPDELLTELGLRLRGRRIRAKGFRVPALTLVYLGPAYRIPIYASRPSLPRGKYGAERPENAALVKALLDHGANPNVHPGRIGPLHMAVRLHDAETVRLLLAHHANPNEPDEGGFAPLLYADARCTALLIEHGANVNAQSYQGLTALMCAAVVRGSGALDRMNLLLRSGARVDTRDSYSQTALMHATDIPAARLLLDHDADIEAQDRSGMTALMMDCSNYCEPGLPLYLIQRGANVGRRDSRGRSALAYARENKRTTLCSALLRKALK